VNEIAFRYHGEHDCVASRGFVVTLQEAGAALRRLRHRRGWTLDYLEERTGLRLMTLSDLERGRKNPRPSTLSRLDSGLGWPPGTFGRLASATGTPEDLDAMLDRLVDNPWSESQPVTLSTRGSEAAVLESYADAYIDTLSEAIRQLPDPATVRSHASTLAALTQCAKAEVLLANSWRVAAITDQAAAARLHARLRELEKTRRYLLARIPSSLPARIDAAFRTSEFPEALIAAMTGATPEQLWQVRTEGVVPDGLNIRFAAFLKAVGSHGC
jgi:transcriptional regulator with XRE-family HTH domain